MALPIKAVSAKMCPAQLVKFAAGKQKEDYDENDYGVVFSVPLRSFGPLLGTSQSCCETGTRHYQQLGQGLLQRALHAVAKNRLQRSGATSSVLNHNQRCGRTDNDYKNTGRKQHESDLAVSHTGQQHPRNGADSGCAIR